MNMLYKFGDHGAEVENLQKRLTSSGHPVPVTGYFDHGTEAAVMAVQKAKGLVVDGIAGPKTFIALRGVTLPHHLTDADLVNAAELLGVQVAAVRAVNEVESVGQGMLPDGRPKILFERHVFWKRLEAHGIDPAPIAAHKPALVSQERGGYQGGAAEYMRLAGAMLICEAAAYEACSWGAFQIMGYHWKDLGYESLAEFVAAMEESEAEQLGAFVRFIAQDAALLAALKARKWSTFAKLYNGPDYARNLYDAKLAQAYTKYSQAEKAAA
ncbi:DUF3380 domain-containing protein [Pseudoduganella sp. FT55W]|uniref:DUF3380 domain-containing protein n=1 Tax=Duganella rivi TaxID=2666083 RepID=A0A7X4GVN2_9BURK|nr:N-acetylmuramidase family protein [Duganella rivi]MYM70528.1 DUF3380 domain-containing protein [Duganella rivi]